MKKPTEPSQLSAPEYRSIAKEAKISYQTVVKWFTNSLAVRPSTEDKIIAAWLKVSTKSDMGIDKRIHDNNVVIAKLESMNEELKDRKKIIQDRLSIIAEL